MHERVDYEKSLLDPSSVFATPEEVLQRSDLSKQQKIEILRRWEYDEIEVAVAEEEGMVGDRPLMLRRILLALEQLTEGIGSGNRSPTKHDGA
jgi:hypothetical protein